MKSLKSFASVTKKTFPTSTYIIVSDLCPTPIFAKHFETEVDMAHLEGVGMEISRYLRSLIMRSMEVIEKTSFPITN
jgi:hypothetical protein